METNSILHALSDAIYQSLWQSLLVYMVVRGIIALNPQLSSRRRYAAFFTAQMSTFAMFLFAFASVLGSRPQGVMHGIPVPASAPAAPAGFSIQDFFTSYSQWISCFYAAGLLIQLIFLFSGILKLRSIRRNANTFPEGWNETFSRLQRQLGIRKEVRLYTGALEGSPFTWGFLKPVIYFPFTALNTLGPEEVEAILLHELAHIRRNDYLFNLIQRVAELFLFFNPVSWILSADIRREREYCCDDLVLQHSGKPKQYARALLSLEQNRADLLVPALHAKKNEHFLLTRIKRFTMHTQRPNVHHRLITLLGAAIIGLSLTWAVPANQEPPAAPDAPLSGKLPLAPLAPLSAELPQNPLAPRSPELPALPAPPAAPAIPDTIIRDTVMLKKFWSSPEGKKHLKEMEKHAENVRKYVESPEWKNQVEAIRLQSELLHKKMESPEWKLAMEDLRLKTEEISKAFESPEWKAREQELADQAEKLAAKFDSPEWKKQFELVEKQSELLEKHFNSPEWKKQFEQIEKQAELLQKQLDTPEWQELLRKLELSGEPARRKD
jgi:bla regulator protein blaR1